MRLEKYRGGAVWRGVACLGNYGDLVWILVACPTFCYKVEQGLVGLCFGITCASLQIFFFKLLYNA